MSRVNLIPAVTRTETIVVAPETVQITLTLSEARRLALAIKQVHSNVLKPLWLELVAAPGVGDMAPRINPFGPISLPRGVRPYRDPRSAYMG